MAIDKRISYQWGGPGGKSPGTSASGGTRGGGGPPGGGDRGMHHTAPTSTPSRSRHESVAEEKAKAPTTKDEGRPTSFKPAHWDDLTKTTPKATPREKAISEQYTTADTRAGVKTGDGSVMEDVYNKPETFTKEELEKGITKDGKTIGYIGDTPVTNKTAREFNLGLKERNVITGEIQRGRNIINPFTQQLQSKFAPIDKPKKGLLGTVGNIALGILAPALLPAKLARAYSMYNQAKNLSKLASTFTGKDYVGDLTTNLRSNIKSDLFSGKTTPTDVKDDRFGQRDRQAQAIAPKKDVITESVQKFSPRQMDLVRQRYNQLRQVMQSGEYMGQRLNNNQLASLQNTSKQLEAFLVDPQKMMMMARGGIAGLHG